jgi:hypothetical protein
MVERGNCFGDSCEEPGRIDLLHWLSADKAFQTTKGCKQVSGDQWQFKPAPVEAQQLVKLVIREKAVHDPPLTNMLEALEDDALREKEAREIDIRGFEVGGMHGAGERMPPCCKCPGVLSLARFSNFSY